MVARVFHDGGAPREACGDVETITSNDEQDREQTLKALYVTGPNGGTRHLLREGLVGLGRSPDATIVVDDPRASRSHAVLHVSDVIELTDLGSANGTFVGQERLSRGEPRLLALGESFFIGDSALVVRATTIQRSRAKCWTLEQIRDCLGRERPDAGEFELMLLTARSADGTPAAWLAAVLSELTDSPHDWMFKVAEDQIVLGVEARTKLDGVRFERAALRRLFSWGITAEVECRPLASSELETAMRDLPQLLRGAGSVVLRRGDIVLRDPAMNALRRAVARVAAAAVSVLVLGETGAGKDVLASMVHELSPRTKRAFVRLNCANFPEALLESELFGHERGAFTGAVNAKPGLLEVADGGTVFLDEIGDLPLPLQAKLLRVMESGEVMRVGAVRARTVDVRFVAATNRNLALEVAEGRFRQDLYYRLNCVTLQVPPLRERPSEIEPLATLFLESACKRFEIQGLAFSRAALAALAAHPWPGNVRELRNVVERAALLAVEPVIEPQQLALATVGAAHGSAPTAGTEAPVADGHGDFDSERERIEASLLACGGNQSRAAKLLGMPRRTLVRRIASFGLPRPRRSDD